MAGFASGLERMMSKAPTSGNVTESITAQVSAAIYYKAAVLDKLESHPGFKNKFSTIIFNQIEKEFGEYIDSKARISPKSLHHVYEWKKVGKKEARLFSLNKIEGSGLSFRIATEFLPSKSMVPTGKGNHRHVFITKASVMESGKPVVISPKYSERIVFEIDGRVVFMPKGKSVTVKRPGGSGTTNQFYLATNQYFRGNMVNIAIKNSGFQKLFTMSLKNALNVPSDIKTVKYKFTPNVVRSQADLALNSVFGGIV
jgi:hypothetical protein